MAETARADLLVSSRGTNSIVRFSDAGVLIGDLVAPGSGGLDSPVGMIVRGNELFVASQGTNSILRYHFQTGAFLGGFTSGGSLNQPADLAFGPDGNLYVSNFGGATVSRFDGATGGFLDEFADDGGLAAPTNLTFSPSGNLVVSSFGSNEIKEYNGVTGAFIRNLVEAGTLTSPSGVLFAGDRFYGVSLNPPFSVTSFDPVTGAVLGAFGNDGSLFYPSGLALGPENDPTLYVTSLASNEIYRYSIPSGTFVDKFGGMSGISLPSEIVVLPAAIRGDMNNSGGVDNEDIAPFVLALTDPAAYVTQVGLIDGDVRGDVSGDGVFDNEDITPFVNVLLGGAPSSVPEPATAVLVGLGVLLVAGQRLIRRHHA
jgi:sugar lactone lactonase YvrE